MTYALMLHEIAHGPVVLPGPLPVNAGESTCSPPAWVLSPTSRWPESVFRAIWRILVIHGRVIDADVAALLPTQHNPTAMIQAHKILTGVARRSGGRLVRHPNGQGAATFGWWLAERIDTSCRG